MEIMNAIYQRRAVRSYTDQPVDKSTINVLIQAAIQAPSAIDSQPWAFAVIQNPALLKTYSDRAKAHFLATMDPTLLPEHFESMLSDPTYNIFYNAPTLIIIYAKSEDLQAAEDCCLAAQNLMLIAHSLGLGTCPIGFARPWLSLPELRQELGIPKGYVPVIPIIVGYPAEIPPRTTREAPEILFWK